MRLPFSRKKPPAPAAASAPVGDLALQAARTAARRRLVGALVLLLIGVVGFPLLFETQPRPLPADLPILMPEGTPARGAKPAPSRAQPAPAGPAAPAAPRSLPADAGTEPVVTAALPASAPAVAGRSASATPPAAPASAKAQVPSPASAPTSALPAKPAAAPPLPKPAAAPAPAPKPADEASSAATTGRFVVQVGAYNEAERLKAARQRVEKLGFKSYTQEVDTAGGKRTRVRVGPFASRQEAEAAAGKLKAAGLQANILSL